MRIQIGEISKPSTEFIAYDFIKHLEKLYEGIEVDYWDTSDISIRVPQPNHKCTIKMYYCLRCCTELFSIKYTDEIICPSVCKLEDFINSSSSDKYSKKTISKIESVIDYLRSLDKYYSEHYNKCSEELLEYKASSVICPICGQVLGGLEEVSDERENEKDYILSIEEFRSEPKYSSSHLERIYPKHPYITCKGGDREILFDHDKILEYIDNSFLYLKKVAQEPQIWTGKYKIKEFIDKYSQPTFTPTTLNIKEKICSDTEMLKQYVYALIKLETQIYFFEKWLEELYSNHCIYRNADTAAKYSVAVQHKEEYNKCVLTEKELTEKRNGLTPRTPQTDMLPPQKPEPPVLKKPGIFFKEKTIQKNEAATAEYNKQIADYNTALAAYNAEMARLKEEADKEYEAELKALDKRIAEAAATAKEAEKRYEAALERPAIRTLDVEKKEMLDKEIHEVEELLKRMYSSKAELYGYDVIFIKYRNPVILASFYEYLTAGRCESLEGTGGAYNIYENELRMDHIIDQLDTVIESLDAIKNNQFLIYSEIKTVNKNLESMNSTLSKAVASMEDIAENTEIIAHNTAAAAYYAKVNAELTNALGFMVALK